MAIAVGRFLSELALVAGAFVVGLTTITSGGSLKWAAGIFLVAVVVFVWARWIAPRAPHRMPDPQRLVYELVLFGGVGFRLATRWSVFWGVALIVVGVVFALLARRSKVPM
jgi:hypothetical protein